MARTAKVERATKESSVLVDLNLDGTGKVDVETGVPFFDHMLAQLGKHGGFDLYVRTQGDVDVVISCGGGSDGGSIAGIG